MQLISLIFWFLLLIFAPSSALAVECGDTIPTNPTDLNKYIDSCTNKIKETKGAQATLSAAISNLNAQISLTKAQITASEKELLELERSILDLATKISSINYSLNDLTRLFALRVSETYKQSIRNPYLLLLDKTNFNRLLVRLEYLNQARDNDQKLLIMLERTRLDYDAQKLLKEKKQKEVEEVKLKLAAQQASLNNQKKVKDNLLQTTKNDEQRYQAMRREAQNRVIQLANYANSRGGGTLLSGTTKCDDWGCYYNQRDSQWGNQVIGSSGMPLSQVGCLVASAAMIATHYGKTLTPLDIASSTNPFEYDTADMRFTWLGAVNGVTVSRSPISCSGNGCLNIIDQELAANRPVIARITAANIAGTHFIVITKKEGDNYLMKDPFEVDGNNISFTSKHQISSLTRIDKVIVN